MANQLKSTATAFIFHNDKLLLIKHKKSGKWMHVGGHIEENETIDEALKREVKEEVNLEVEFIQTYNHFENKQQDENFKEIPIPFYIHARQSKERRTMSFDFLCIAKNTDTLQIQDAEIDTYKWVTLDEIQTQEILWEPLKTLAIKAFETYNNSSSIDL